MLKMLPSAWHGILRRAELVAQLSGPGALSYGLLDLTKAEWFS